MSIVLLIVISSNVMKETELDEPLRLWLTKQGYEVYCEVKHCDIVAKKDNEIIIIELKTRFSLDLIYQAVNRKRLSDSVYVAVPVPLGKKNIPRYTEVKKLLSRLEVGLILLRFLKSKTKVELISHPSPFQIRRAPKRRESIIREIDGRYAEFNKAGSTTTDLKVSAYKQQALVAAHFLQREGELSPSSIRAKGGGAKTQSILSNNIYGWFDKVKRGVYCLNEAGSEALVLYKEQLENILELISEQ